MVTSLGCVVAETVALRGGRSPWQRARSRASPPSRSRWAVPRRGVRRTAPERDETDWSARSRRGLRDALPMAATLVAERRPPSHGRSPNGRWAVTAYGDGRQEVGTRLGSECGALGRAYHAMSGDWALGGSAQGRRQRREGEHVVGSREAERRDEDRRTPRARPAPRSRSACSAAVPAWWRAAKVAAAVRPRSASTRRHVSSRSRPTRGRSSTVACTSSTLRPACAHEGEIGRDLGQACLVGGHVAAVTEAGGDAQRPRAPAAHDDREVADRPGVAGRLGERDVLTGIRLGARRPERPHRLDPALERIQSLCGRGELEPVCRVLALPPSRTDPDERPSARERRQGGGRLGGDAGSAEGHGRDEGAELEPRRRRRQGPEGDPRLRDRVPGAADLRDLDEVVHQGETGEAGRPPRPRRSRAARRAGRRRPGSARPGGRRPSGQSSAPMAGPAAGGAGGGSSPGPGQDRCPRRRRRRHDVPALVVELRPGGRPGRELAGEDARRHRTVACGVARPAYGSRGVEHDGDGGQPGRARPPRARRADAPRRCPGCRRRSSGGGAGAPRRSARAGRRRRPRHRDRAHRCRRRRAGHRRRRPRPRGSGRPAHVDLPEPEGPTSTTSAGSGRSAGMVADPDQAVSASDGATGRRARPRRCGRWGPR